jgi:hypothetical protein
MSLSTVDLSVGARPRSNGEDRQPIGILATTRTAVAVRTTLAFLLVVAALALPWLGLTLSPSLSAWHLTFSLAAVPLVRHLSYGVLVAVLGLCAAVSFVRSGGRPTPITRMVGWAYIALPMIFLVTTRLVGTATMFALQSDNSQTQVINSQFLTNSNLGPPSQFLGVNFDGRTLLLLYGLRLGWYLLLAAGIILAGRVGRPSTRLQWATAGTAGLAFLAVLAGLGLGSLAQSDLDGGIQAIATGRPAVGQALIGSALRLNPDIAYDPLLEQALGQSEADQGRQTGLADYAEAVRPVSKDLTLLEKGQLFGEAVAALPAGSPAGAVVRVDLATFLANATITSKNPDLLTLVDEQLSSPAVTFSVGHYFYEAGAETRSISLLEKTYDDTPNSEVRSLALTYIALAWLRLGNEAEFRTNIVAAVHADRLNENVYAREIAAGLYVPGTP